MKRRTCWPLSPPLSLPSFHLIYFTASYQFYCSSHDFLCHTLLSCVPLFFLYLAIATLSSCHMLSSSLTFSPLPSLPSILLLSPFPPFYLCSLNHLPPPTSILPSLLVAVATPPSVQLSLNRMNISVQLSSFPPHHLLSFICLVVTQHPHSLSPFLSLRSFASPFSSNSCIFPLPHFQFSFLSLPSVHSHLLLSCP